MTRVRNFVLICATICCIFVLALPSYAGQGAIGAVPASTLSSGPVPELNLTSGPVPEFKLSSGPVPELNLTSGPVPEIK
jgi:hypothetical protein